MLRRKLENIDIAGDEVAKYVGKGIHGIGGEGESILQELGGIRVKHTGALGILRQREAKVSAAHEPRTGA
jgi:hypothetical protein